MGKYRPEMIFHGSEQIVEKPFFGGGKSTNDYGKGFYCTSEKDLACEWSVTPHHDGYVNCYKFDWSGLNVLDLSVAPFTPLHWLTILLENRTFDIVGDMLVSAREYLLANFRPDYETADVIVGYRADDSYFSFARTFLSGALSYANLSSAMRLGHLGLQIVLKSEKAFDAIAFVSATPTKRTDFLQAKEERDISAREAFRQLKTKPFDVSALYMLNILQERMTSDDPRLQ